MLPASEIESFRRDGFLVVKDFLSLEQVEALRDRFPKIFAGQFDTGIYPDEWYWREGMSLPDVTRHIGNAWKADLTIARLVLSSRLGEAASKLAGWPAAKLGQDTIWWKAPHTKSIAYHQDSSFTDFLDPPHTVTCWVTLDDTSREAGTIEYVAGSHLWPLSKLPAKFHGQDNYRDQMTSAARFVGVPEVAPSFIEVPAGSCVFHSGNIWHGSGPNTTGHRMRRSIGTHLIRADATFSDRDGGYIYRRYQRVGDRLLDESFFPVLWSRDGYRTPWIDHYCQTGRRTIVPTDRPAEGTQSL